MIEFLSHFLFQSLLLIHFSLKCQSYLQKSDIETELRRASNFSGRCLSSALRFVIMGFRLYRNTQFFENSIINYQM